MKAQYIFKELEKNVSVFNGLLTNLAENTYLWRPEKKKWNLLEIVCHLYDEEQEDFRPRLKHILEQEAGMPPGIDPEGWVISRKYAQQEYSQRLQEFLDERKQSLAWLYSLEKPDWNLVFEHPQIGRMTGRLFLNNWLAHDYHHIRQIVNLKYAYLKKHSTETLQYAGDW